MLVWAKNAVAPFTPTVKSMYAARIAIAVPSPTMRPKPYDMYE